MRVSSLCAALLLQPRFVSVILGMKVPPLLPQLDGAGEKQLDETATESSQTLQALSRVWDGMDMNVSEMDWLRGGTSRYIKVNMPRELEAEPEGGMQKKLALLGPFDSGTNLLMQTLKLNYPNRLEEACGYQQYQDSVQNCRVWKHGVDMSPEYSVENEPALETIMHNQGVPFTQTVLVIMVRSPLSQLASWRANPYRLRACVHRPISSYDKPCTVTGMTWLSHGDQDRAAGTITFKSTMDIYNTYLRMYKKLQASKRFHKVLIVTYEDLVFTPEVVVSEIARAAGWPLREQVMIMTNSAKVLEGSVGRRGAVNKMINRPWLETLNRTQRELICNNLDKNAYGGLAENSHRIISDWAINYHGVAYGADCAGFLKIHKNSLAARLANRAKWMAHR